MTKLLASGALVVSVLVSSSTIAAERTLTLAVQNMYCDACPLIVRKSLEAVPGVAKAVVSFKDKTAVVTFDDSRTDAKSLMAATTKAGYPSVPRSSTVGATAPFL
ncbi:MAG TPA: mercury resistance system periplasmic binding protein MerP [Xanthobacteraceae bacterium]|nr:mercury resistance system periplasmic binding protein MerP [Xanthobacteraceae bacterium]